MTKCGAVRRRLCVVRRLVRGVLKPWVVKPPVTYTIVQTWQSNLSFSEQIRTVGIKKMSTITVRVKRSARAKHTSGGVWTVFTFSGLKMPVSTPTVFNVVLTVLIHYSQNLNSEVLAWFLTSILMCDVALVGSCWVSNWTTQFGCLTAHVMETRIPKEWVRGRQVKIQVHVY